MDALVKPTLVPVDQAMPPPSLATSSYLQNLGALIQDMHSQQKPQAQATVSQNRYALNYADNPYTVQSGAGGTPQSALYNLGQTMLREPPAKK